MYIHVFVCDRVCVREYKTERVRVCVRERVSASVFVSVCLCVCERDSKRKRERQKDITLHELVGEIKNLNSDKSPGDDVITNHMIQAAGRKFPELLHEMFSKLWVQEIQLRARQMSLMQPIYKRDNH